MWKIRSCFLIWELKAILEMSCRRQNEKGILNMAEFGENLKRIREEKGMTQQTLADYLYVTRQAVSRWEGGGSLS